MSLVFGVEAYAGVKLSALGGINASQVTATGNAQTNISNGYASFEGGFGISVVPNPNLVLEANAFLANRKFGFGSTQVSFTALQFPVSAQYHFWKYHIGGGAYAGRWIFPGEMIQSGKTREVLPEQSGQRSNEYGFVATLGFTERVVGVPLRFEVRRLQSLSNLAAQEGYKTSLVEWQVLLGYELDLFELISRWIGKSDSAQTDNPSGTGKSDMKAKNTK